MLFGLTALSPDMSRDGGVIMKAEFREGNKASSKRYDAILNQFACLLIQFPVLWKLFMQIIKTQRK
jgi:hypothetical protein